MNILNLYLYYRKISQEKNISLIYYLLANLHLGFLSFNFYESKFLAIYLLIFALLAIYIYLAYKWMEEFNMDSASNDLGKRIQYLTDEKDKVGKVRSLILESVGKADSLLKK